MASIPSPIIFDILIQLPVKSLSRFKSLNKLCHSFIRDPYFIRTHLKNGADKANNLCLILSRMEHQNLSSIIHFLTVRDIDELAVVEYSAPVSFDSYSILPSCGGLVCFYGLHGGVHVCNPSTKSIVRLPDIDAEDFRILSCGFGLDQMSGNHKIIRFLESLEAADPFVDNLGIGIFAMGNNSWRIIRYDNCLRFLYHQPPEFAGGFLYWITADSTDPAGPSSFSIVSFDIGNEVFEAISPPENVSEKNWHNLYLAELGGELCLVDLDYELDRDRKGMDIWLFKSGIIFDKKEQCWAQETIFHPSEPIDTTRPVAFNGKEILLHGFIKGMGHFNWFNLQTGCFRELKIKGTHWQYFNASHHVQSLSPVLR